MDDQWTVSSKLLADWAGITQREVEKLVKEKPAFRPMRVGRGKYNFYGFTQCYLNNIARNSKSLTGEESDLDVEHERARYHKAAADEKEIKNRLLLGELASVEDFKQFALKIQGIFNSVLDALPGRISGEIVGEIAGKIESGFDIGNLETGFIYEIVRRESNRARQTTSARLKSFADRGIDESTGDSPTNTGTA